MTLFGRQARHCALWALVSLAFFLFVHRPVRAEGPAWIKMNERLSVPAGEAKTFLFTATSNNLFRFQSFGKSGASAALYTVDRERRLSEAEGFSFEARLTRGETYLLDVSAPEGEIQVEIMRAAFGRYFDRPIQLMIDDSPYKKAIAQPYDTHWYQFIAEEDGVYSIYARSDIGAAGYLLDENGESVGFDGGANPSFLRGFYLQASLKGGRAYYIRVCAKDDAVGDYALYVSPPADGAPVAEGVVVHPAAYTLKDGESAAIEYHLTPTGARSDVLFVSSNPALLHVSAEGVMTAHGCGKAEVAVVAGQNVCAVVQVVVDAVAVEGISFADESAFIKAGQAYGAKYEIMPSNASNRAVVFSSSDPAVAQVDEQGVITGVAPGEAVISAVAEDGGAAAEMFVNVGEPAPKYRALVVGERQYEDGRTRLGSANTTQGIYDMLSALSFEGEKYAINMRMDVTRGFVLSQIRRTFRDAINTDVSLFYINCHGGVENGEAYIEFSDTKRLTAGQLERELRRVPGTVIVMIDCCNSGAFISGDAQRFNRRMVQAFEGGGGTPLLKSKYLVMTSASSGQDSYRVSYNSSKNEDMNATAFSLGLCESGGWDILKDRRIEMKADLSRKRVVTFNDVYAYTRRRVRQLLSIENAEQDVQVYPEGSNFPIFMRN